MLNIPVEIQTLFQTDGVRKMFRVHFPDGECNDITNEQIVKGSVKFTESVSSKDVLQFGIAEGSQIEFECVGVQNIYGARIWCAIEIEVGDADGEDTDDTLEWLTPQYVEFSGTKYYRIPYGEFLVESCPRQQGAMKRRRVVGTSEYYVDPMPIQSLMYRVSPFKNYILSESSLYMLTGNSGALSDYSSYELEVDVSSGEIEISGFYDSAGYKYTITLSRCDFKMMEIPAFGDGVTEGVNADFLNVSYTYTDGTADKYKSLGDRIADAIDGSDEINITYDKAGKKIYKNAKIALQRKAPFLFAPCVVSSVTTAKNINYDIDRAFVLPSDSLVPLPTISGSGVKTADKTLSKIQYKIQMIQKFVAEEGVVPMCNVTGVKGQQVKAVSFFIGSIWNPAPQFEIDSESVSAEVFYQTDPSDINIIMRPTLAINKGANYYNGLKGSTAQKDLVGNAYTFANALSYPKLLIGLYEIRAQFGKIGRDGRITAVGLSKSNPIHLSKSDYQEMWWDEYSVEEIGTIRYAFGKEDSYYEYVCGEGQSVYDMEDNELLKHLYIDTSTLGEGEDETTVINNLLETYFVPNVADISFVPVDLEARGLPYLEAGDYLEVDDDDGGTVGTYILERKLSGVHTLEDQIESQGGEIISEDTRSI